MLGPETLQLIFEFLTSLAPLFTTVLIPILVAYMTAMLTIKSDRERQIDEKIARFLEIEIEYPLLSCKETDNDWAENSLGPADKSRYESFCCLAFNLAFVVFKYYRGNRNKVCSKLHVGEIIRTHCRWWRQDTENRDGGYPNNFCQFVDSFLKEKT